jgi:hypothetical protein
MQAPVCASVHSQPRGNKPLLKRFYRAVLYRGKQPHRVRADVYDQPYLMHNASCFSRRSQAARRRVRLTFMGQISGFSGVSVAAVPNENGPAKARDRLFFDTRFISDAFILSAWR